MEICDAFFKQRYETSGLFYEFHHVYDRSLDRIFCVAKEAYYLWVCITAKVVLFDTKHGTNTLEMKSGVVSSIDSFGKSRILSACFLKLEDEDSTTLSFGFSTTSRKLSKIPKNPLVLFDPGRDEEKNTGLA